MSAISIGMPGGAHWRTSPHPWQAHEWRPREPHGGTECVESAAARLGGVLLASDGATMPGGSVCEVCAQIFLTAQKDRTGKEWHAVAPLSGCDARDRLISLLIERLDIDVEDPDAHQSAIRKVVDYLSDYLGEPNTTPITLTHDDHAEELTRWYRLWRGWLGCRTASGAYEFFSEGHWSPMEVSTGQN